MRYEKTRTTMREMVYVLHRMLDSDTLSTENKQIAKEAMKDVKGYLYENVPERAKIGQSKRSMGAISEFSGKTNHIMAFNTNPTKNIYDENFQSTPHGKKCYIEFVRINKSINNSNPMRKAA